MRGVLLLLALGACTASPRSQQLTVLAASSLTDAFTDLKAAFEVRHPTASVTLSFAGSQTLTTQVRHGLRADVIASADQAHIEGLHDEGLVKTPREFTQNSLVVASWTPRNMSTLDTAERLVIGTPQVPIGRYTAQVLDSYEDRRGHSWRQDLDRRTVSRESSVRLVLAKLLLREADTAIVYATDVAKHEGITPAPIRPELHSPVRYHHAQLTDSANPRAAQAWLDLVEGPVGHAIFVKHDFKVTP